jgi:hypothetical protein
MKNFMVHIVRQTYGNFGTITGHENSNQQCQNALLYAQR